MKHLVSILLASALLGAAVVSSGHRLDAVAIVSILFCSGLTAWTVSSYIPKSRPQRVLRRAIATEQESPSQPVGEVAAASAPVRTVLVLARRPLTAHRTVMARRAAALRRARFPRNPVAGDLQPTSVTGYSV